MWKLFLSTMAAGLALGLVYPFVLLALVDRRGALFAVSVAVGLGFAFTLYLLVKSLLRAFVHKMHTLERVVAGTKPSELPPVWASNEIDEVEKSAARIVAKLNAARAEAER
jgi:HAMP domain-containing protein